MAIAMIGPKFYAWDRNGKPLAFGKLYTYQARTNVPKPTYQSEDQVVENTNPVILNGEGYANIYLDGSYKMVLKDDQDNEIWSSDPVSSAQPDEWVNCFVATYVSPTSLKISGNHTDIYKQQRKIRIDNNAAEYEFSTIVSSTYSNGETFIVISDPVVTTGIQSVCASIVGPESSFNGDDIGDYSIYRADSIEDMIAGITNGGVVTHEIGGIWIIKGKWIVESISDPMTISNFKPIDKLLSSDFGQDDDAFDLFKTVIDSRNVSGLVDEPFNLSLPKTITGNIEFTKSAPLNLVADIAGQDFITFGLNLVATGYLKVDVSNVAAKCNDPIKFDGSLQYGSDSAPKLETVFVEGKNHVDITGGLTYNSTVDGGDGRSFIQYTEIESLTMLKCRGIRRVADETTLTDSWVTANTIKRLTLTACKEYSVDDAIAGAEVSNNTVIYGVIQYGALEGVFPTKGIEINAGVLNDYTIFVYDWNSTESPGPIVKFDNISADNRVKSSPLSWQKQDNGSRNRYESLQDSSVSNIWVSAWERSFLGHQDNILAHWSGKAGTLTGVASGGSGDRAVNVTNETVNVVETENEKFLGLTSIGTSGNAFYEIEFRSTTTFPLTSNMLMFKFDKGFEPSSAVVQVDTGSGYQNVASIIPQDDECFARFDVVGGTDIRTDIRGYKIILTFTDNREVRIRNIAANGTFMTCYPSRGGDFMGGDLVWKAGAGPVLTDTATGTEYRVQVTNGNLVPSPNPTKKTTFLN